MTVHSSLTTYDYFIRVPKYEGFVRCSKYWDQQLCYELSRAKPYRTLSAAKADLTRFRRRGLFKEYNRDMFIVRASRRLDPDWLCFWPEDSKNNS